MLLVAQPLSISRSTIGGVSNDMSLRDMRNMLTIDSARAGTSLRKILQLEPAAQ